MDARAELDAFTSVQYLYLRELSEPRDNSLRITVEEAVSNTSRVATADPTLLPELQNLMKDAHPIETTDSCRTFEMTWKRYVAYLVTEECVGSCGKYDDETFQGKLFRLYTKSHFLDHLLRDTGAHTEPILHYKLICLNHLVDIAAYASPEVRVISPTMSAIASRVQ